MHHDSSSFSSPIRQISLCTGSHRSIQSPSCPSKGIPEVNKDSSESTSECTRCKETDFGPARSRNRIIFPARDLSIWLEAVIIRRWRLEDGGTVRDGICESFCIKGCIAELSCRQEMSPVGWWCGFLYWGPDFLSLKLSWKTETCAKRQSKKVHGWQNERF